MFSRLKHWINKLSRTLLGVALVADVVGCRQAFERRMVYVEAPSELMGRTMQHSVYVPPQTDLAEGLPLVLFLHGSGDGPDSLDRAGVTRLLDERGHPSAIIVSPQGHRGFWENWANGKRPYRDWILRELLPSVQEKYKTRPCPEGCHVVGISMGGHGALSLLMRHPDEFKSFTVISAPILDTQSVRDFYDSTLWQLLMPIDEIWGPFDEVRVRLSDPFFHFRHASRAAGANLILAWGDRESPELRRQQVRFSAHLREVGISHRRVVFQGGHAWKDWTPVLVKALVEQLELDGSGK